jgi:aminomethyltransferase
MKKTPLYSEHLKLNAKMVPFGGFEMPLTYRSIAEEHHSVRTQVGMFDVSHMGEFIATGPDALDFMQTVFTNQVERLAIGDIQYGFFLYENGTVVDDLLVYRLAEDSYLMVVNASNIDKDWAWLQPFILPNMTLTNESDAFAEIALQGPQAQPILQTLCAEPLDTLKSFTAKTLSLNGHDVLVSRTGYTGEDGFELYASPEVMVALWTALLAAGVSPIGLGARDTLRFEAALPLYGHELSERITPLEAGLTFALDLTKDFIGKEALMHQKEQGLKHRLVGLEMSHKGIMREGYSLYHDDRYVGVITTGYRLPTQDHALALAFIDTPYHRLGTELTVDIRGKRYPVVVRSKKFREKYTQ